ncbi:laminin B domain-containing protein [Candidatus Venteria ishoeyi]|uniref:Laminin IV type A domain-containing protein n=1 Tax=Candidatus Venteria ishoeyi TaxID=1899563 RepID=A0A1H6F2H7_9GAMM|nr:laminin B domain-containing protein [Candidatus Venteria ishoeyi]SEH04368.1 Uncharacterised protein [Candidatus Venteria ishoeyi]
MIRKFINSAWIKYLLSVFLFMQLPAGIVSAACTEAFIAPCLRSIPANIGTDLQFWTQPSTNDGLIEKTTEELVLQGAKWTNGRLDANGYADGNAIISSTNYNHVGVSSYIQLKIHADNQYLGIQAKAEGLPVGLITTHHSFLQSKVIPEDSWLFMRTQIETTGAWQYVIAQQNYDDAGGTVLHSYSGSYTQAQITALQDAPFIISFFDNYGGENTYLTLAEVIVTDAEPVIPDPEPIPDPVPDPVPDPDPIPDPEPQLSCSPQNLTLCETARDCFFEGQGTWCNDTCSTQDCPIVARERPQCGSFDSFNKFYQIPCLSVDNDLYQVSLSAYPPNPFQLKLESIRPYEADAVDYDCAEYTPASNKLHISCIDLGEQAYWADLRVVSINLLELQNAGEVNLQAPDWIKYIDINVGSPEPLVMTVVDSNDRYYRFYGVKDVANQVLYYDRLVLDQFDAQGVFKHYMTLNFDAQSRLTGIILAEDEGQIALEYLPDTQVKLTVNAADGSQESVMINNPFASLFEYAQDETSPSLTRSLDASTSIKVEYVGGIQTCDDNTPPEVSIQRNFSPALQARYPLLARAFNAQSIYFIEEAYRLEESPENFNYKYSFSIPGHDYDAWSWQCRKDYIVDVGTGFIGGFAKYPAAAYSAFNSMIKDYRAGSTQSSTSTVMDTAADKLVGDLPLISTLRKVYEAAQQEGVGEDGGDMCSERVYDIARQRLLHPQTLTVKHDGSTQTAVYQPTVRWNQDTDDYMQLAPSFDFSAQCDTQATAIVSDFDGLHIENYDRWGIGPMAPGFGVGWFQSQDVASYNTTGGNPDGYISWVGSQGDWWYFVTASDKYSGDKSFALNKMLSFDLKTDNSKAPNYMSFIPFVVLSGTDAAGNAMHLYQAQALFQVAKYPEPGSDWTSYSILLNATAEWKMADNSSLSGASNASDADIRQILSTLSSLRIRGEYGSAAATGALDNVVFGGN